MNEWYKCGFIYGRKLLSYKNMKKGNPATCNNMSETRGYYAQQNKLQKDKHHMIPFICGDKETRRK